MVAMESFANRVDKIFGSLGSGMLSSWRVSDQQERMKVPSSPKIEEEEAEAVVLGVGGQATSSFCSSEYQLHGPEEDFDGMDVEDDAEEEGRQMRRMVGLDATLDFEDEEDEFDKAALGREGNVERLYMREIREVDRNLGISSSLPLSFYDLKTAPRDPRANHLAARARLEEDAREAAAATVERKSKEEAMKTDHTKVADGDPGCVRAIDDVASGVKRRNESRMDGAISQHLANIEGKSKPYKRVRFALDLQEPGDQGKDAQVVSTRPKAHSYHASQLPDYVRNPSKYTHYTLDWSVEDNERSNMEAITACTESLRKNLNKECGYLEDSPKKIQYIARHSRTVRNNKKSNMELANQSVVHISRTTMCINHFEKESDSIGMLSVAVSDSKNEESAPGSDMILERKSIKAPKKYRLKKEAEEGMEI